MQQKDMFFIKINQNIKWLLKYRQNGDQIVGFVRIGITRFKANQGQLSGMFISNWILAYNRPKNGYWELLEINA